MAYFHIRQCGPHRLWSDAFPRIRLLPEEYCSYWEGRMRRREFIVGIAGLAAVALFSFTQRATAQSECRLAHQNQSYKFTSDTIEWTLTAFAGQTCFRGIRQYDAIIDHVTIVTPPKFGELTIQGPAFYYQAEPNFQGSDAFELLISGERRGIKGASTIRAMVTVR